MGSMGKVHEVASGDIWLKEGQRAERSELTGR